MPPRRHAANDRGMQVLEQKLGILTQGPSRTRRNPALDVLTGRVPDERVQQLQAHQLSVRPPSPSLRAAAGPGGASAAGPSAMLLPVAAIRMAAVARSQRPAPSPWLQATSTEPQHLKLKLITPPTPLWSRMPWLGPFIARVMAERRSYKWMAHSPRARLAS